MTIRGDFFNRFNKGKSDFVTPGKQLEYISQLKPDSSAIICIDKEQKVSSVTWHELHVCSNRLACFLMEKGVGPGSVIVVTLPNSIEHIIAVFAIWKTGACYLPVPYKTAGAEMDQICQIIAPEGAFSDFDVSGMKFCLDSRGIYSAMEGQEDTMPKDITANPNMISLSGGTSGKLKFIRQNVACGLDDNTLRHWFAMSGMDFEQRQLFLGPLFHGAPHTAAFNGLFAGNTLIMPRNLCPDNVVRLIKEYQIEFVQTVPTVMNRILKLPDIKKEDFASVKALCHTGGYCFAHLKKLWIDLLGPEKVYEIYSMTEIIGLTCIRGDEWLKHYGSIGLPAGTGKISIRDEEGRELPPYKIGEIFMTPPVDCFITEYINQEPLKAEKGGFKSVGDIGYMDDQGYLYFSDRRSDMLVIGGENVFATEVEAALLRCQKVIDAVVIGIPDEEWGRRLHAVVEAAEDISKEELVCCLGEYLPPYKIPKSFEFVKRIPRGDNGKADRDKILKECITRGI